MEEKIKRLSDYLKDKFFKYIDVTDLEKIKESSEKLFPFLNTRSLTAHFLSLTSGIFLDC